MKSKLGEGSIFVVEFPFKVMNEEEINKYKDDHKSIENADVKLFANRRVLVVEDNELNREIATELLLETGLVIETASDGSLAVDMIREKGPKYFDFVLMDIQMPVMNGYEATKKIRELFPNDRLPIIALSANAFAEDRAASLAAGMDDHVSKPINMRELTECLLKYI